MIHNGCTTGIESYLLGRPTIAFRPLQDPDNELMLPNNLGAQAATIQDVVSVARGLIESGQPVNPPQTVLDELASTMTGISGSFASERVLDVIDRIVAAGIHRAARPGVDRLGAYRRGLTRAASKTIQGFLPFHKNSRRKLRHRFPDLELTAVEAAVRRLDACIGRFSRLRVRLVRPNVFEISPG
jgi:hypothetical protein